MVTVAENKVMISTACKKSFQPNVPIKRESINKCIQFAHEMAFGAGYHNPSSFGNNHEHRKKEDIFRDALQGKLAEIACYNYLFSKGFPPDQLPDFQIWKKGKWEDIDFTFQKGKYKLSIKSTKYFGNLLCLEKHKYDSNGNYLESVDQSSLICYDFTGLVRIKGVESGKEEDYKNSTIECEVTGFITKQRFMEIIKANQSLPKGVFLGSPMKVDNYYECASKLISFSKINKYFK